MTSTSFKTRWEAEEYHADHGQNAAIALGYQGLAAYLSLHGHEDAALLGLSAPARPDSYHVPVIAGTDAERAAKVDAWAGLRGTRAFWHETTGTYRAEKHFGPVKVIVYMKPHGERSGFEAEFDADAA